MKRKLQSPDQRILFRHLGSLFLRDGVLYRKRTVDGNDQFQLIVPTSLRKTALAGVHDDVAHLGCTRSLQLAQDRFFWPRMARDVEEYVKQCPRCIRRKSPKDTAPLYSLSASQPFELLCIDYLGLEPNGNVENILVMTDVFTRYSLAVPCKSTKARPTAKVLFRVYLMAYYYFTFNLVGLSL